MRALVVYDSTFGNTEQIAMAVSAAIGAEMEVGVVRASLADPAQAAASDLLVVGSPTNGGRATRPVQDLLKSLPSLGAGIKIAAFDTRVPQRWAAVFGYAAPRIAAALQAKGGHLAASPEAFYVDGQKGPLKAGELARAGEWGARLARELSAIGGGSVTGREPA